jgi:hypothetical protein
LAQRLFFTIFIVLNRIQSFLKLSINMKKLLMLFALVAFVGIGTTNAQVETAAKKECAKTSASCCSKDKAKGTAMKASVKDAPAKASGEAAAKKECTKKDAACCSKTKAAKEEN